MAGGNVGEGGWGGESVEKNGSEGEVCSSWVTGDTVV